MPTLQYDHEFYNRIDGQRGLLTIGKSLDALDFEGQLRWFTELARGTKKYRDYVILGCGDRGAVDVELGPFERVKSTRSIIGGAAWALGLYDGPSPAAKHRRHLRLAKPGIRLDTLRKSFPAEQLHKWGVLTDAGSLTHYFILDPPTLLIVETDLDETIGSVRTMNHREGGKFLVKLVKQQAKISKK